MNDEANEAEPKTVQAKVETDTIFEENLDAKTRNLDHWLTRETGTRLRPGETALGLNNENQGIFSTPTVTAEMAAQLKSDQNMLSQTQQSLSQTATVAEDWRVLSSKPQRAKPRKISRERADSQKEVCKQASKDQAPARLSSEMQVDLTKHKSEAYAMQQRSPLKQSVHSKPLTHAEEDLYPAESSNLNMQMNLQRMLSDKFGGTIRSRQRAPSDRRIELRLNSEGSVKLQVINQSHSRLGDLELSQESKEKYQYLAKIQKNKILEDFGKEHPEIMTSIKQNKINNSFAIFWPKVMLLTYTYNYLTCFWLIGFPGFPTGMWFYCEALAEVICLIDFAVRLCFPQFFKLSWQIMYLLHDKDDRGFIYQTTKRGISSIPTSLILAAAMHSKPAMLTSFWVACIRLLKLLRFRNFSEYFDPSTVSEGTYTAWVVIICEQLYKFMLGLHVLTILFILPNRFEHGYGWFVAAGYYSFPNVYRWQQYIDSMMYVVSNMSGMGFGNIVPVANGEWFAAVIIFAVGQSVYIRYYSDFAYSATQTNIKFMENHSTLAEVNKLAETRYLPEKLRQKIRYYFKNLRIPFEEYKKRKELVTELPVCMKEEISLLINQDLIQNVKFFSLCSNEFILKICRFLKPHISIINEYVFYKDSLAKRLFFINEGVCEVTDGDDKKLVRFLSKGAFFGEIGLLLTGKRTCSVIVRTTCIMHAIRKEPLNAILEEFPQQLRYLKHVGKQRLTDHEVVSEETEKEMILSQLETLSPDMTVFGELFDMAEDNSILPKLRAEFAQNMEHAKRIQLVKVGINYVSADSETNRNLCDTGTLAQQDHFTNAMITSQTSNYEVKPEWWQTKDITPDQFLIIPFSPVFIAWNTLLFVVVIYDVILISLTVVFGFKMSNNFVITDVVIYVFHLLDMGVRAKTAIKSPKHYCFDPDKVLKYYLHQWFMLDLFVAFPLCYILMISPNMNPVYVAVARLPRLLKIFRLNEMLNIIKWNLDIRVEIVSITQLFLLYGLVGLFYGCGYYLIGRHYYDDHTARYDGQTLWNHMETRPIHKGILDKISALSPWDSFRQFVSFGIELNGASPFGDIIPQTLWEQVWDLLQQTSVRVIWAMVIAESTSFFASRTEKKAKHDQRRDNIVSWMQQNHTPKKIISRYKQFEECNWDNFQGLEEQKIIKTLPRSLRLEVRSYIMKNLIENWEAFPQVSPGTIETVITMLFIRVYPRFEYIITEGELAEEMYFIIKGVVEIRSHSNDIIATLKQGQNFGEMALLDDSNRLRSAHAISQTTVSLAVLTKDKVEQLCKVFPSFKHKLEMMIRMRKAVNRRLAEEKEDLVKKEKIKAGGLSVIHEARESMLSVDDKQSHILEIHPSKYSQGRFEHSHEHSLNSEDSPVSQHGADVQEIEELNLPNNMVQVGFLPPIEQRQRNLIKIPQELISVNELNEEESSQSQALENVEQAKSKLTHSKNSVVPLEAVIVNPTVHQVVETQMPNSSTEQNQIVLHNYDTQFTHNGAGEQNVLNLPDEENQAQEQVTSSSSDESYLEVLAQPKKIADRRNSIAIHFKQMQEIYAEIEVFDNWNFMRRVVKWCVTLFTFYNLVFLPLQFAFRIKFERVWLALEILTVLSLLLDIGFRVVYSCKLQRLKKAQHLLILKKQDRSLAADQHTLIKKLHSQYFEIVTNFIAAFPISAIVQTHGNFEPFGVILCLQSLRFIVKIKTIWKFWSFVQDFGINIGTLFAAIFYYYALCHWLACAWLSMSLYVPDHRTNWLRIVPRFRDEIIRETPNVYDDLTKLEVYNYALYLMVNTVSNLTVGDVIPITLTEKMAMAFVIWSGTFIYNFFFASMCLVVGNLMSSAHLEFINNYNKISQKIREGKFQESVICAVQEFNEYIWYRDRGVSVQKLRQQLPPSLAHDLSISIHKQAIERSLLFHNDTGDLDIPLALSIFKRFEFQQFLPSDFIVKVGQLTTETYILLEGELRVYGLYNNELLGVMTRGSHFGLDLGSSFEDRDELCKFDERLRTEFKMDFPGDNFENRSIVHVVANSPVLVGVLSQQNREILYQAFPRLKMRMQYMNRTLFQLGKVSLENHTKQNRLKNTRTDCRNLQLNDIMLSTKEIYNGIIDLNLTSPKNSTDLSVFIKKALLSKPLFCLSIYNFHEFRARLLESDLQPDLNFDSQRNPVNKQINRFSVKRDSKFMNALQLVQLINVMFIAFFVPFTIAFKIPFTPIVITLELISLLIQAVFVVARIRTPVIVEARFTLDIRKVLYNYYYEGLVIDLFGLLPFNLILGSALPLDSVKEMRYVILISVIRVTRVVSTVRGIDLIDRMSIYLKAANYYVVLIQAVSVWYLLGHFIGCGWFFWVNVIERDVASTWKNQQELGDKNFAEQYLRVYYFVLNIGTGIGSGDMIPQNEVERFIFNIVMTVGDAIWCLGFGLIFLFWGLQRRMDPTIELRRKIHQLEELLNAYDVQKHGSKQFMEEFFAYESYTSHTSILIDQKELLSELPITVVKEVMVQANQKVFSTIFTSLQSYNLIRQLCFALKGDFYTPEDYIIKKGDQATEIFFILDGTVLMLAQDKYTIAMSLRKGEFFGEIEVLTGTPRIFYAQAATFCTLNALSSEKFEEISAFFPQLRIAFEQSARKKEAKLEDFKLLKTINPAEEEHNRIMGLLLDNTFVTDQSQAGLRSNKLSSEKPKNRARGYSQESDDDNLRSRMGFEQYFRQRTTSIQSPVPEASPLAEYTPAITAIRRARQKSEVESEQH